MAQFESHSIGKIQCKLQNELVVLDWNQILDFSKTISFQIRFVLNESNSSLTRFYVICIETDAMISSSLIGPTK